MIEQAYGRLREGSFEDAVEAFSECLLLEPAEPSAYYGRALSYFQLKKWPLAASDFLKAKDLNPANSENWIGFAMSLAMDNKIYEAIQIFEELLTQQPNCVRAHIQLAQLYYRLGVIGKGHCQLDRALASRPSLVERRAIERLKNEQLVLDKKRYYRPDFEALRRDTPALFGGLGKRISWLTMDKNKRDFVFRRGVLGIGLPVAVLMSLTVAFQRPGFIAQFQGFNLKTFLFCLSFFAPLFLVAGYFWGLWVYRFTHKK